MSVNHGTRRPTSQPSAARRSPASGVFEIREPERPIARGAGRGAKARLHLLEESIFLARWPEVMLATELDEHLEELIAIARQARRAVVFVVDMTISIAPPASVRNEAAKKLAVAYEKAGYRVAGVSHVIASPIVRGVVTAVHWLSPAPFPTHMAESVHESVNWGRAVLELRNSRLRGREGR